jgi:hypothetical protein
MGKVVELNPVDGLPEWKGRVVVTARQKARAARRARRFVIIEWDSLISTMNILRFGRAQRLFFVLGLHRKLQMTQAQDGWLQLERADLIAAGLADCNFTKAVVRLERAGLIEVQRRPGKRPLLRLVDRP